MTHQERRAGFFHKGRVIFRVGYEIAPLTFLMVTYDRQGEPIESPNAIPMFPTAPGKRMVTVKAGDEVNVRGERRAILSVYVDSATDPLSVEQVARWQA